MPPRLRKRPGQVDVARRARHALVVGLQAAKVHARGSEVRHFGGYRSRQLPLESERPLADVRRRHVVLGREDERGCSGARERLLEAEVRPEGLGRLVAADRERRVADDVEHGVADVPHVVDAAAHSHHGFVIDRPGQTQTRSDIVVVGLVCAAAETAVAHVGNRAKVERRVALIRIARARPHEDRCVAVVPCVIDVDELVVRVRERLVVFPPQTDSRV